MLQYVYQFNTVYYHKMFSLCLMQNQMKYFSYILVKYHESCIFLDLYFCFHLFFKISSLLISTNLHPFLFYNNFLHNAIQLLQNYFISIDFKSIFYFVKSWSNMFAVIQFTTHFYHFFQIQYLTLRFMSYFYHLIRYRCNSSCVINISHTF